MLSKIDSITIKYYADPSIGEIPERDSIGCEISKLRTYYLVPGTPYITGADFYFNFKSTDNVSSRDFWLLIIKPFYQCESNLHALSEHRSRVGFEQRLSPDLWHSLFQEEEKYVLDFYKDLMTQPDSSYPVDNWKDFCDRRLKSSPNKAILKMKEYFNV